MTNSSSDSTGQKHRRKHSKEFKEQAIALARQPEIGFRRAAQDLGQWPSVNAITHYSIV